MTNLVVIDCHDLGRHLGCYGHASVPSPHLDALASRGVRFAQSFCTAPQCSPSRATLYTGRYSHTNGMLGLAHDPFNWRLHADEVHLAAYLRDAGYETAHVGIQHVTAWDADAVRALGFEHAWQGHDDTAQVVADAVGFLSRDHPRPFFLNIGFFDPHRDHTGGFTLSPPDDSLGVDIPSYLPATPEARRECAALQGAIRTLDNAVGAIWRALEANRLVDDTWFVFTTDHGLAMPRAKCTMYDPGLEAALLMIAPALGLQGGRVINEMISHVDFVPTVLDGLGLPLPKRLHGWSYWPLLQGREYQPRKHIFASKTYHTAYEPQRAIRSARHKLILNLEVDIINVPADIQHSPIYLQMIDTLARERPQVELYDLRDDPGETQNLAGLAAAEAIERDLLDSLLDWMRVTDDPILRGPISSPYYDKAMRILTGAGQ